MNAFDKVIGYQTIKDELLQICDMIHNREIYAELGAKMPNGVLLYGEPGIGKTLMAKCFITESGLQAYTVRRNKGTDNFVREIEAVFEEAKQNAPAIVFLDDMDKFANEDEEHRDAEEYVAVQAGIDAVKDKGVFVFATVNNMHKLPRSLTRSGRFDRKIKVCRPSDTDAFEVMKHYLKGKKIADDVDLTDVVMMVGNSSCAELETVLNEAAINAAYARRTSITMNDLTKAALRMEYDAPDSFTGKTEEERRKIAVHEAGHLVVCEMLCPGSVGLASLRSNGRDTMGGFIRRCKDLKRRPYHVLVCLAGKAAVELYYADATASGCQSDIRNAVEYIRSGIAVNGTCGLGVLDVESMKSLPMSESLNARSEVLVQAELERYLLKAREILLKNKGFLEKTADMLMEKETLLYSDIKAIRETVPAIEVYV